MVLEPREQMLCSVQILGFDYAGGMHIEHGASCRMQHYQFKETFTTVNIIIDR